MKPLPRIPRLWNITLSVALALAACDPGAADTCTDQPGRMCMWAGASSPGVGFDDVPAQGSKLYFPMAVAFTDEGVAYLVDRYNHRVREVRDGIIRTVVGTGDEGSVVSGPAAETELSHPAHLAIDGQGRVVIAAWWNSLVARWDPAADTIAPIVGDGERTFAGDGGPAVDAKLDLPVGVSFDADGDLYVVDQASQRIRRVDDGGDGVITTVVGTGEAGFSGDGGPALEAQISAPLGQTPIAGGKVIFDADGWMILADNGNHRIRTVDPDGIITTLAGTGEPGASGDGAEALDAELNRPSDVTIGPSGRLYIADTDNHCVRRLETDGTLSTIIGKCGKGGAEPTGIDARDMRMYRPFGITFDPDGLLYVVDTFNHRIMRMRPR